jgi:DNA adenine methylase
MTQANTTTPKPFARWPGGKRRLLPRILPRLVVLADPHPVHGGDRTYVEPFVGGGACFFALRALGFEGPARINDLCVPLVASYLAVQADPLGLHAAFRDLADTDTREAYYERRANPPVGYGALPTDPAGVQALGAWFLYINRAGFNGLWRENQRGTLNTPYGDGKPIQAPSLAVLQAASRALRNTTVTHGDFADVELGAGDVCYLDSPYLPLTKTASFTAYTGAGFDGTDQLRLAAYAKAGAQAGATVVLSNAGHADAVACFATAASVVESFQAPRSISCKGDERRDVKEYLFTFNPGAA